MYSQMKYGGSQRNQANIPLKVSISQYRKTTVCWDLFRHFQGNIDRDKGPYIILVVIPLCIG